MAKIIYYQIDGESCYNYALSAYKAGDYILCVQNINEGLALTEISKAIKSKLYELLILLYENSENNAAKMDIMIKNAPECLTDFGKVDFKEFFTLDDSLISSDEEENNNEIFIYNQIKDYLIMRDYCNAFGKLLSVDLSEKYLVKISDYICLAFEQDKSFNVNDYFVPAITLLAKLEDKNKLISVMLASGGACRDLAIDGMGVFADDIEDLVRLLSLGEMYYINGLMDSAKDIYKKALQYSLYNEDALFHLAAISYAKGEVAEGDKYFAKYKALFSSTYLPINMYEKYFESNYAKTTPVVYPYLDTNFVDEIAREVIEKIQLKEGVDGVVLKDIAGVICTCEKEEECFILPMLPSILTTKKLQAVILYLLGNPSINNSIKRKLLLQLYNSGYQGRYTAYYDSKLVTSVMVALGEGHDKAYQDLYRDFLLELPFANAYLPLRCNVMKNVISKVEMSIPKPLSIDIKYIAYLVLQNYAKSCKILVDWEAVVSYLKIDSEYALNFLTKNGLSKWIIK